ncbi:kinase-like domain-containing protein [Haematococcus lacustris]|uniref:Kinase-like domain-containing protein n=1 Tax=Haematococcus lacustris TaxID=44745 RepID=A0A699YQ51_HAELA|nr:kinase-like domain-containing protein [Haematococcus lacustris]
MLSLPSSGNASLPVTALFEALLARDLAHPNIIKCYDVRCCKLSRPFITLLRKNAQHKQLNQTTNILRSHTTPCGISQEVEEEDDDDVKQVLRSMTGYTGMTPLWSVRSTLFPSQEVAGAKCNNTSVGSDFGLARLVVNNKCINKQVSGTTAFMAPELFRDGEVSCSTDIYAFGITLW